MIKRFYDLEKYLEKGKVLIIFGARQVGKTSLIKDFLSKTKEKYLFETGENFIIQELLSSCNLKRLNEFVEGLDILIIDEAQVVKNIGRALKLIIDHNPNLKIITTGSSAFDLGQKTQEPLTGRKKVLDLFPISQKELLEDGKTKFELRKNLEDFLIFGSYPEIILAESKKEKQGKIKEIAESYLFKDILILEKIKKSIILFNLLKLISFQLGQEVSVNELAQKVGLDTKTTDKYLDILEKAFIIKRLYGFSRNLRNEITKKVKIYFYDLGIRNAIISQFNPLNLRNDVGALWENFLVMERFKKIKYEEIYRDLYFWRTYEGNEIDLLEDGEGKIFGYEIKWGEKGKIKKNTEKIFLETYKNSSIKLINQENFFEFVF
ncbi:ATP-binding protein [Candidatus Gracilibacteria bacterium]|nr:ATP-binding protein [Candidatus Gracilibacteria bacterium]